MYMYNIPGAGADNPLGLKYYHKHKSSVHLLIPGKFIMVFAIYSHGGHLGHVTLTIYINFHSLFLRMLHIEFGFNLVKRF